MQQIGNWGIGWSLKGGQNRYNAAFSPLLNTIRGEFPSVKAADPDAALLEIYRDAFLRLPAERRQLLEQRFIGVFAVDGLGCAGKAYPVFDQGTRVAVFAFIDQSALGNGWCGDAQSSAIDGAGLPAFLFRETLRLMRPAAKSG